MTFFSIKNEKNKISKFDYIFVMYIKYIYVIKIMEDFSVTMHFFDKKMKKIKSQNLIIYLLCIINIYM